MYIIMYIFIYVYISTHDGSWHPLFNKNSPCFFLLQVFRHLHFGRIDLQVEVGIKIIGL